MGMMALNFIVDPLQQFRISALYPIYFDNAQQRHLNPGLAKNYDYESIILGTSHTKNFKLSEVEEKLSFTKCIKFTIAGASAYEESRLLNLALTHTNVKNVLYGLDVLAYSGAPVRKEKTFPEYLYEDNSVSALVYLLKFDTTIRSFWALIHPYIKKDSRKFRLDKMYEDQYAENEKYAKSIMLAHPNHASRNIESYRFERLKRSFEANILEHIKQHTDVNYTIFYPPYSIMAYQRLDEKGVLPEVLLFKKYMIDILGDLPNVVIYDFQIAKAITHNLNNYKDYTHYHQRVTSWILEQIKVKNFVVTHENVNIFAEELVEQSKSFKLPK
jgi:hypothetical protein